MMQTTEKITRDELRAMALGESRTWQLTTVPAMECARATASQMSAIDGVKYTISCNMGEKLVTITKG